MKSHYHGTYRHRHLDGHQRHNHPSVDGEWSMTLVRPMPDLTRHVVVTRHRLAGLRIKYEDKELMGVKLMRPFPTAKVQFFDHHDGWLDVYWICETLTRPRE